jgi:LPXTG-motif cell wall-anchored protein
LPKTGSNTIAIIAGFLGTIGAGVFFFKKFKLI